MRRYLDHLRKKPDHTKRHIALAVSSLIFLGMILIMISTFSIRFPGLVLHNDATKQSASVSQAVEEETTYDELRRRLGSDYVEVEDLIEDSNGVTISEPDY